LFIFDEPTTGLHFHDISKLLKAINALVDLGHSVIVIEHNLEVIKSADWIIDLGPEGGEKNGGNLLFAGTPEEMVKKGKSYTAHFLKEKI
jgi:excinuclease ABC subunit A